MTSINTPVAPQQQASVDFGFSPHGSAFSYVIGGTVITPPGVFYATRDTAITFTATVQFAPERIALEYFWDFGDGSTGYGNPIVHTFTVATSHSPVSLRVTDDLNHSYHVSHQAYINPPVAP